MTKKDYMKLHDEQLQEMRTKLENSKVAQMLEIKAISSAKIETLQLEIEAIIHPHRVMNDFNYRTGNIMGIIRTISLNSKHRKELLEVTGLNNSQVSLYYPIIGNTPFVNNQNQLVRGQVMKADEAREYITMCALSMGIVVDESDLYDITQERCQMIYDTKLQEAFETIKNTAEVSEDTPEEYEE